MLKIANDIIILYKEDMWNSATYMEESLTGFDVDRKDVYKVDMVFFKNDKYFRILKSRYVIEQIGLKFGQAYAIKNYSDMLYIYYIVKNNKNLFLQDAKKEALK